MSAQWACLSDVATRLFLPAAVEQLKTTEDKLQKILAAARPNSKSQLSADTPFSSTGSLYSAPYTGGDASEPSG